MASNKDGLKHQSDGHSFRGITLLIVRSLLRDRSQLITTILAIAVGIALLVSVEIITASTQRGVDDATRSSLGDAQVILTSYGGLYGLTSDVVSKARLLPGVTAAVPEVQADIDIKVVGSPISPMPLSLDGIDLGSTAGMDRLNLAKGRLPVLGSAEIVLPVDVAKMLKATVGSTVLVHQHWANRSQDFRVVGLAGPGGAESVLGFTAFVPLKPSLTLVAPDAGIRDVQLKLHSGVNPRSWVVDYQRRLGPKAQATVSSSFNSGASSGLKFISSALACASLCALIAAMLRTYMALSVRNRKRSQILGGLRAIGMSQKQAVAFMAGEAWTLGILAGVLGAALGSGVGIMMVKFDSRAFNFPSGTVPLVLPWTEIGLAVVAGGVIAVLGALASMRVYARRSPIEALRGISRTPAKRATLIAALVGMVLVIVGIELGLIARSPYLLLLIAALEMLGMVLLVPAVLKPFGFLVSKLIWIVSPVMSTVVFSHVKRERSHTSSMISSIMVTLILSLTVSGILAGERKGIDFVQQVPIAFPATGPAMDKTTLDLFHAVSGIKSESMADEADNWFGVAAPGVIADEADNGLLLNDYPFTVTGLVLVDPGTHVSDQLYMFQAVSIFIGAVCFFSLLSGLVMSAIERNRETALLRAAGATPHSVASMVILEAFVLCLTGLVAAVGGAAVLIGSTSHLLQRINVFYFPVFPWSSLPTVVLVVVLAAGLAGVLPAIRSARVSPSLAVRGD